MRKKYAFVEALECRRLLHVAASTLAFPLGPGANETPMDNAGSTDDYTVIGPASFNGHNAIKVQDVSSFPGQIGSDVSSVYIGFDSSGNFDTYGSVDVSTDTSSDPAVTITSTETINPPIV